MAVARVLASLSREDLELVRSFARIVRARPDLHNRLAYALRRRAT
jgi:hypothetical protein